MVHTHSSTASQRVRWVSHLLAHEGTYGEISQMSRSQQVSRQTLYTWKQKGQRALEAALNVVDVQSGEVWASLPQVAVDGESWTLALWYLQEQGVVWSSTVSDGGRAIAEALRTTKAISAHQRDVWHLLHLAGQVQAR